MTTIFRPISDPDEFDEFGCHPFENDPATPDRTSRQVFFRRQVSNWNVTMKDRSIVKFWGFKDPDVSGSDSPWPSKLVRVKQGQVVHCEMKPAKGAHTIHWHGIEPTPMNDGVGHTSFEVKGSYTYQWCAHQAGTYLYHCHKNTVLHFEMGMYGVLIVDPATTPPAGIKEKNPKYLYDPFDPADPNEAPGIVVGAPYATEAIWAYDDVDPVWHVLGELDHNAGMCGQDVGLDSFNPKYFLCSGAHNGVTTTDSRTLTKAKVGTNVLVRLANASYSRLRVSLPVDCFIVEVDGRPLRTAAHEGCFAKPEFKARGEVLEIAVAQRYSLWIPAIKAGTYDFDATFNHWITNAQHADGRLVTRITAT